MRKAWVLVLVLSLAAVVVSMGCKRQVQENVASTQATHEANELKVEPAGLVVGGATVVFAPARLDVREDGGMRLVSEGEGGNSFSFQMMPTAEGEAADGRGRWSWIYELTNPEEQASGGIRAVNDPENGLRPVELRVEIERVGGVAKVTLSGRFVSLSASNPLAAQRVDVQGSFNARWAE